MTMSIFSFMAAPAFTRLLATAAQRAGAAVDHLLDRLACARRQAQWRCEARQLDAAALRDLGLSRGELAYFLSHTGRHLDGTCRRDIP
jgi:uncharacterized protein YjiS (DUF1127 family)